MTNRNTKWILALLLCVLLALGLCMVHAEGEITDWGELQAALDAGGTVTLTQDITAGADDSALTVLRNVTVTLNLNGYTINRGLANGNAVSGGSVIVVKGTLVVTGEGTITGGNTTGQGGGVYIDNGGKFTMNGGTITGNTSAGNGAGVFVVSSATFTVNGNATVSGNTYSNDDDGSMTQNVYLGSSAYIRVGDSFTGSVGVWTKEATYIKVTQTNGRMDDSLLSHFSSDRYKEYEGRPYGLGILDGEVYFGPLFNVTVTSDSLNGTVTANRQKVILGGNVTLTFEPADKLSALSINGNNIELTNIVNGVYTCEDIRTDVAVNVTFVHFSWNDLQDALNNGGAVTLTQDYTAASGDSALTVPSGKTVTLDLNDYTLNRGMANSAGVENGYVILNEGTLTITDSGSGGKITGGNNTDNAGGIYNSGSLTLTGGSIIGNKAALSGGGIFNTGTLTITGGSVTGNTATGWHGGGVYNGGTMNLSGGSVTGNHAQGGQGSGQGGGILNNGTLNVSGAPVVSGNTGPNGKNIYMRGAHPTMTVNGALTAGASLYVTSANGADAITSGYGTNNSEQPSQFFHTDSTNHHINLADGEAWIVRNGAATVTYIERSWNGTAVVYEEKTAADAMPVPSDGNMTSGWYYLNSNVTKNGRIESITGNVNLILSDGCTLDVKGLYVPAGKTLTIYGQTGDTGKIYSHPGGGAAIGGYSGHDNGNIVIHGGTIEATGADNCAAIGTNDSRTGGSITIYGGTITAQGGTDGAGIGGGENCSGGTITIYGGTITANSNPSEDPAGIGGGYKGAGGTITIWGGTITTCSRDGAGIGGGDNSPGGNITIHGGTITCNYKGNGQGARIGGGSDAGGGTIVIDGGVISANGNESYGGGIGGGWHSATASITLGWTAASEGGISIKTSSFNGTVTLAQPFGIYMDNEWDTRLFTAGPVPDNSILVDTDRPLRAWNGKIETYIALHQALNWARDGATLKLSDDYHTYVSNSYCSVPLHVRSGQNVTIDLNGQRLYLVAYYYIQENEYVILNEGKLTITDTSAAQDGTISGGYNDGTGGGIYNKGTLTLDGGGINGNKATGNGGGVYNEGTFTMTGGFISDNWGLDSYGGGVYNASGATFNMTGGNIRSNYASGSNGGGVYNASGARFNMSGGSITGNTSAEGSGVYNEGTLTMTGGSITGNEADRIGGGVCNAGTMTIITGGSITGNTAKGSHGGGVYNVSGATFNMTDGTISGNTASENGGGVYNASGATFNMTDGSITGNTTSQSGGGVCNAGTMTISGGSITGNTAVGYHGGGVYNSGTMNLKGGSITGNEAQGGLGSGQGGGILNNGNLYVEGVPVVSGNTGPDGNNIYMRNAHRFMTITGKLTTGASLYVTSARGTDTITSMFSDYNGTQSDPSSYFHSDSVDYVVVRDGLEADLIASAKVIFAPGYDTEETMPVVPLVPGSVYELPVCGFTAPDGKTFAGWSVGSEIKQPGNAITVNSDTPVTAVWQNIPFGTPDFVLPADVTAIEANAFEGIAATVVEIPANCTSISSYAFKNCTSLTRIRIPATCALGTDVFDGCTKVYIYGTTGSQAESYCSSHSNCVFVEEEAQAE